jgi:phospholipid/cholesterol/gamma-HCH transport system substrate-binding protein
MNFNISKEVKLALLAIMAILLFIFGFNYLKGSDIFSSSKIITAEYDDVSGLTPSSYVTIQGMNVGSVKTIEMSKVHLGKILVKMDVQDDVFIPSDSKAKIISLDLLGTKAVSIMKGNSTTNIASNQSIQSEVEIGMIEKLGAGVGPLVEDFKTSAIPAIDNANHTISTINQTVANVNQMIDAKLKSDLKATMNDMSIAMQQLKELSKDLNAQQSKINSIVASINSFTGNLEKNGPTITKLISNTETTTSNLKKVDFEGTVLELKKTMTELQTTVAKINSGNGSLALLMNDDKLYKTLKNTLATTNNLLYDFNAHPSRYIHVSVFGKKNKNETPPQPAPNSNE